MDILGIKFNALGLGSRRQSSGGGGGGIVVAPDSDFSDYIDSSGAFTEDLTFESDDGMCQLSINQGTIGLTEDEEPLDELTIVEMEDPPDPPPDSTVIGLTYQLGPEGVSFDSPTTLIFTYDPSLTPEGVSEENLLLATWDDSAGEWVVLEGCTVDVDNHTISAPVSHFSTFAILAYTRPAALELSDLTITPGEVNVGETVAIISLITNTGDLAGTYEVTLKINDVAVETKQVEVTGGAQQRVAFTLARDAAGTYTVNVDGLSETFEVKEAAPKPINWQLIAIIAGVTAAIAVPLWVRRRRRVT
jgi:hypothetical protein